MRTTLLLACTALLIGCAGGTVLSSPIAPGVEYSVVVNNTVDANASGPTTSAIRTIRSLWDNPDDELRIEDGADRLFLSPGWYIVTYSCPDVVFLDIPPEKKLKVEPGVTYRFVCEMSRGGSYQVRLKPEGALPNQPLHPDASRASALSAGERRR